MDQNKLIDNGEWKEIVMTKLKNCESLEQFYSLIEKKFGLLDSKQNNILLDTFPQEILLTIFIYTGISTYNSLVLVCRGFRDLLYPQPLWKFFFDIGTGSIVERLVHNILPFKSRNIISANLKLCPKTFLNINLWVKKIPNLKTLKIEFPDCTYERSKDSDLKLNIDIIFDHPKITSLCVIIPEETRRNIKFLSIFSILEKNFILRDLNLSFAMNYDYSPRDPNEQFSEIRQAMISFLTNCHQRFDSIYINIQMAKYLSELWKQLFEKIAPFLKCEIIENAKLYFVDFTIQILKK